MHQKTTVQEMIDVSILPVLYGITVKRSSSVHKKEDQTNNDKTFLKIYNATSHEVDGYNDEPDTSDTGLWYLQFIFFPNVDSGTKI